MEKTLKFHFVSDWGKLIYISEEEIYFASLYKCPNSHFRCFYQANDKTRFERHMKTCIDPEILRSRPTCIQKEYGTSLHPLQRMISDGLLSEEPYMTNFIFYDIESLVVKSPKVGVKTDVLATHKLLSIAATAFHDGELKNIQYVILKKSSINKYRYN